MNKKQLLEILQSSLLYYEGTSEEDLNQLLNPMNVTIGIKLVRFLEEKVQ